MRFSRVSTVSVSQTRQGYACFRVLRPNLLHLAKNARLRPFESQSLTPIGCFREKFPEPPGKRDLFSGNDENLKLFAKVCKMQNVFATFVLCENGNLVSVGNSKGCHA